VIKNQRQKTLVTVIGAEEDEKQTETESDGCYEIITGGHPSVYLQIFPTAFLPCSSCQQTYKNLLSTLINRVVCGGVGEKLLAVSLFMIVQQKEFKSV